jgi:hypothetical protein
MVLEHFGIGLLLLLAGITAVLSVDTDATVELFSDSDLLMKLVLQLMMVSLKYYAWRVYAFLGNSKTSQIVNWYIEIEKKLSFEDYEEPN